MINIIEINGNIFESKCQTLVNTVNCYGVMGKGLALEFKYRFPQMFKEYYQKCKVKFLKPGILHLWKSDEKWIINFPTKNHWKYPSKIEYIELGLKYFTENYTKWGVKSIAFPELGTNAGGLKWEDVKKIMYKYLEQLKNIEIEIYHYSPDSKDSLFEKFYKNVVQFELEDYKNNIGLNMKQSKKLMEYIKNVDISKNHSMLELQKLKGLRKNSIVKIYNFSKNFNEEKQQRLF
jgi:O-acetyl-ADP-ribose deacetylase (regulator of RNase III)